MKLTLRKKITIWEKIFEWFGFVETGYYKEEYDTEVLYV